MYNKTTWHLSNLQQQALVSPSGTPGLSRAALPQRASCVGWDPGLFRVWVGSMCLILVAKGSSTLRTFFSWWFIGAQVARQSPVSTFGAFMDMTPTNILLCSHSLYIIILSSKLWFSHSLHRYLLSTYHAVGIQSWTNYARTPLSQIYL